MTAPWQCPQCRVWKAPTVQKCECAVGPPEFNCKIRPNLDGDTVYVPGRMVSGSFVPPTQKFTSETSYWTGEQCDSILRDIHKSQADNWVALWHTLKELGMSTMMGDEKCIDRAIEFIKAMHADREKWNDIHGFIMSIGGPSDTQNNAKWQVAYVGELFTKLKYAQCPWEKYKDCLLEQAARVCEKPGKSLGDSDSYWGPEYARRIRLLKSPEESQP